MIDSLNGKVRVRKWPKKRGTPKSAAVRAQNDWFREANRLAKFAAPSQIIIAMEVTKGTGLYPRDLLLKTMSSGLVDIIKPDGTIMTHERKRIDPVAFQGVIQRPVANIPLGVGVSTTITWGLPVRDTAGFWNAGAPTRFTIPQGITEVELSAGMILDANVSTAVIQNIRKNGGSNYAGGRQSSSGRPQMTISTGPTVVVAGDYFEYVVSIFGGTGLVGSGPTFFTLTVLGAL